MVIPTGYAQLNWQMDGTSCPLGAEVVMGVDLEFYGDDIDDLAAFAYDEWVDKIHPIQTSTTRLSNVHVKYGPSLTGPSADHAGSAVGDITSAGVSPNTALLVTKNTADGGRGGRGRAFMPGLAEADVDTDGGIDSTYLAVAQAQWADFGVAFFFGGAPLVVLHSAGSPITDPSPITSFTVQSLAATQRRRLRH